MKHIVTLLICLFAIAGISQTVPEEQRTLLTKKTATWCPHCGTWGWTMMEGMIDDIDDRALIVGAHHSGDLKSDASTELVSILSGSGQPRFYEGKTGLGVNSGNVSAKLTEVKTLVDDRFENTSPVANAAADVVLNADGSLRANTKVQFFQDADGQYSVSVLLLDHHVSNNQASLGVVEHPYVLRDAMTETIWGEEIVNGAVTAGTEFDLEFNLVPDASWDPDRLNFAVVIWEVDGNSYNFVNGTLTDEYSPTTSVEESELLSSFTIVPNVLTSESSIYLESRTSLDVQVDVFNLLGKRVLGIYDGPLEGKKSFDVKRDNFDSNGMYLVRVKAGKEVMTKRIMVK